jgi:hypothetical protein
MRTLLRLAALFVALAVIVFWLFGGPNLGWTKNRVAVRENDPITGIEVDRYQERFVPGVDFLGGGLVGSLGIGGCSFFFRRSTQSTPPSAS